MGFQEATGLSANAACIFCRIAAEELPADRVFEDSGCIAFRDIAPKAPVHVLVIPRQHFSSLDAVPAEGASAVGHLVLVARDLARRLGLTDGYRLVVNTGPAGGQTVDHLHVHLLGGRDLQWPPG